jgi:hypothetical protein
VVLLEEENVLLEVLGEAVVVEGEDVGLLDLSVLDGRDRKSVV